MATTVLAQPKVVPVAPPNAARAIPESKFTAAQLRATPVWNPDAMRNVAARKRPVPTPGLVSADTVILRAGLQEASVACGQPVTARLRLLGGTRTPGLHTVTVVRAATFPAGPAGLGALAPLGRLGNPSEWRDNGIDQRTIEVLLGPNEERDVLIELGWALRCTEASPFEVDAFFVGVVGPGNPAQSRIPNRAGASILPVRPSVSFEAAALF